MNIERVAIGVFHLRRQLSRKVVPALGQPLGAPCFLVFAPPSHLTASTRDDKHGHHARATPSHTCLTLSMADRLGAQGMATLRYWCHQCTRAFDAGVSVTATDAPATEPPTCPHCRGDFVEVMEEQESVVADDDQLAEADAGVGIGNEAIEMLNMIQQSLAPGSALWRLSTPVANAPASASAVNAPAPVNTVNSTTAGSRDSTANAASPPTATTTTRVFRFGEGGPVTTVTSTTVVASSSGNPMDQTHAHDHAQTHARDHAEAHARHQEQARASDHEHARSREQVHTQGHSHEHGHSRAHAQAHAPFAVDVGGVLQSLFGMTAPTTFGQSPANAMGPFQMLQFLGLAGPHTATQRMHGQPGDYVFGARGLDDVITRLMEQQAGGNAPPPASSDVLERLPRRMPNGEEESAEECAVCKDPLGGAQGESPAQEGAEEGGPQQEQPQRIIILPCAHKFHEECGMGWLGINGRPVAVEKRNGTQRYLCACAQ